jgi:hypothetical protein
MHLQLHVSVKEYLHYAAFEFEVHFCICIAPVEDSLLGYLQQRNANINLHFKFNCNVV